MKIKRKAWSEIIGYLCVFIVSMIVSTVLFITIDFLRYGEIALEASLNTNHISAVGIGLSLLIYMLTVRREKKLSLWKYCGVRKISIADICLAIGLGILLNVCISFITQLKFFQVLVLEHDDKINNVLYPESLLIVILVIGILAPIMEEILFRGLIYQSLRNSYSITAAIFLQATIFAIIHINPLQIMYTFLLALLFMWLANRTNSLLTSILAHSSFNLTTILLSRIIKEQESAVYFLLLLVFAIAAIAIGGGARVIQSFYGRSKEFN